MATYNSQFQEETRNNHKNTNASIRNLEVQVGQIAQHLSLHAQSTLPSSTVINPKNQENVNAVTTRSKKIPESEKHDETDDNMVVEVDLEVRETEKTTKEVVTPVEPNEEKNKKEAKPMIKLPFPTRGEKKDSKENEFEKFTTLFKKKFMKDVIAKKKPTGDEQKGVIEKCGRISPERRIPIKKKDPGAVAIPCTINNINFPKVLIDSGASVSLMPLSIFKKLGIGIVREKGKKLKFADHTIKQAYVVAEDVLVEIDRFIFLVDFEIMDIPEDEETCGSFSKGVVNNLPSRRTSDKTEDTNIVSPNNNVEDKNVELDLETLIGAEIMKELLDGTKTRGIIISYMTYAKIFQVMYRETRRMEYLKIDEILTHIVKKEEKHVVQKAPQPKVQHVPPESKSSEKIIEKKMTEATTPKETFNSIISQRRVIKKRNQNSSNEGSSPLHGVVNKITSTICRKIQNKNEVPPNDSSRQVPTPRPKPK
ncbi:uncharacterized protein LOC131649651 [Vicia villosa]|uniref:uncharacterized protein LOC131649651 n=1 Tax=Vicia villosa TaxID=3911 RepID=UPI00273C0623|nr:uncharacterized protein LOC131649651 [Vicia villosa]